MANDRLYLKCMVCGGALHLGKHSMDYWHTNNGERSYKNTLNDFHEQHKGCMWDIDGTGCIYRIMYESDKDFSFDPDILD